MQELDIQQLLNKGIAAAKAAQQDQLPQKRIRKLSSARNPQKEQARRLLQKVTELDDTNVRAWLWLSTVVDDLDEQRLCLSNALMLEPHNKAAQAGLDLLEQKAAAEQANAPPATAPVKAKPPPQPAETESPPPPDKQTGCPFCRKPIGSMDMACPHCNLPLVIDCPQCNTLMDIEWAQCSHCDFELGDFRLGSVYFAQLAEAYQSRGRATKAAEALAVAERLEPDQPDLRRQIGEVQAALGHTSQAVASLEKAIQLEPEQAGPYLTLGKVLQQEGHWRQAEKVYRQAAHAIPTSPEPYFALGALFFQRNQFKQAQKYLQKSLQLDSQHGPAWVRMGQLHEAQKRRAPAIRAYRRAEKLLQPDSMDGKLVRDRLRVLQPKLPSQLGQSWLEFSRQTAGPLLVCLVALLLDSGLRPWWIPWTGWLALFLALPGSILWISGYSLPENPFICAIVGPRGLGKTARPVAAVLGALLWLLAMGIIIMPINQSYPEPPL